MVDSTTAQAVNAAFRQMKDSDPIQRAAGAAHLGEIRPAMNRRATGMHRLKPVLKGLHPGSRRVILRSMPYL